MRAIGVIALGMTGKSMSTDLFRAGAPLTVWSRTESGMAEIAGPGAVAGKRARVDAPVPLAEAGR